MIMCAHLSSRVSMSAGEEGAFELYVIRPVMHTWVCNAPGVHAYRVGCVSRMFSHVSPHHAALVAYAFR